MKLGIAKLLLLVTISLFSTGKVLSQSAELSPNIIILIADDVGVNDIGCYGNSFVDTPNIDYLASNGLKFNNAFLTTSSCSPSRISIITGRYPHNTGAAELHTEPDVHFSSIASQLKEQGYYTGQAGKWHMGNLLKEGFDQIFEDREQNGAGGEKMWIPSLRNRDKNKPFFFWFASYDAHRPWEENTFSYTHEPSQIKVPPTLIDNDSTRIDLAQYYDEIKRWDYHIGKVVRELKRQEVFDNTLIVIMSDNGRPFPRDKTRMYDSGLRTPFIVHWPKNIKKAAISNSLISAVDIAPTILDICKSDIPETFQGRSFKGLIEHPGKAFRNYVFGEHNWHDHEAFERMVRTKEYLYIQNFRPELPNQGPADAINSPSFRSLLKAKEQGTITEVQSDIFLAPRPKDELYQIKTDSLQTLNLISGKKHSDVRDRLKSILKGWMRETCDNVPKELTKDWYTRDTGKRIEDNFQIRGDMPGEKNNAERCNAKGAF
ncbi:sulfatase family protein [Autumnicola musiva]|uniref:Sulfatase n=1 Tax=Autumnicola musiva TaxID=3075589 RepID=A0ABU3DA13_9FLAO|nr:sulfatase [Zunongwangia sp. F117]MDT0678339.1 sulfatase [Zunongwangia sp. F117]